jgi:hypothetical protein
MAANNTDSASSDSSDRETLAELRKLRTGLILQKHKLEQAVFDAERAVFDATIAAISTESIDVSQIDLSAWDDFQ